MQMAHDVPSAASILLSICRKRQLHGVQHLKGYPGDRHQRVWEFGVDGIAKPIYVLYCQFSELIGAPENIENIFGDCWALSHLEVCDI